MIGWLNIIVFELKLCLLQISYFLLNLFELIYLIIVIIRYDFSNELYQRVTNLIITSYLGLYF